MSDAEEEAADRRWAAAAKLVDGDADEGLSRRRRRTVVLVAVSIVGAAIVGVGIGLFTWGGTSRSDGSDEQAVTQLIGQFVFIALGFVVGVSGFIWARRNGYYITRWRHAATPLTRQERKRVQRQIAGKEAPDSRVHIVVGIARQNRRATLGLAPIYSALVLLAVATAIGTDVLFIKLLDALVVVLFGIVAISLVVTYRRAGRFIARYGPEGRPTSE